MRLSHLPCGSSPVRTPAFELAAPKADDTQDRRQAASAVRVSAEPRPLQPVVIRFGRLGDMVMLSAVLHFLHHRFLKPCIVLGAGTWNAGIYLGNPDVARILSFTRHLPFALGPTWWRVLPLLHRLAPGPIYVCERHPRQLNRIRRLLAWSGIDHQRCLFITDMSADGAEHWVDRLLRFARQTPAALSAADYPVPDTPCRSAPRLQVLPIERAEREAWLQARGWAGRPLVLVQPGNFRSMSRGRKGRGLHEPDDKAWPVENWVALLGRVHASLPGVLIMLCGAPAEGGMLRQIQAAAALDSVAVAELPLRQLVALCESAHSMISVDTGPAHAAAALGLPLVVMYGAESPQNWLPRSPFGTPVLGVGGPPAHTRVDQISVDEVFNGWYALVAGAQSPPDRSANVTPTCSLA